MTHAANFYHIPRLTVRTFFCVFSLFLGFCFHIIAKANCNPDLSIIESNELHQKTQVLPCFLSFEQKEEQNIKPEDWSPILLDSPISESWRDQLQNQLGPDVSISPMVQSTLSKGYTKSKWWISFVLKNNSQIHTLSHFKVLSLPDLVELYESNEDGKLSKTLETGRIVSTPPQGFKTLLPSFVLQLAPQSSKLFLAKISSTGSTQLKVILTNHLDSINTYTQEIWVLGIFLGTFLILVPFTFLVSYVFREVILTEYGVYCICAFLAMFCLAGVTAFTPIVNYPNFNVRFPSIMAPITALAALQVMRRFLKLASRYPQFHQKMKWIDAMLWFLFVVNTFGEISFVRKYAMISFTTTLICGFGMAAFVGKREKKTVLLFVISYIWILIGAIITNLEFQGIVTLSFPSYYCLIAASWLESFSLMVAIGVWLKERRQEQELIKRLEADEKLAIEARHRKEIGAIAVAIADKMNSPLQDISLALEELEDLGHDPAFSQKTGLMNLVHHIHRSVLKLHAEQNRLGLFRKFVPLTEKKTKATG